MAEEEGSVPISVKLKIHYTFDAEHKIDHLTRPTQSYEVETVTLEDGTTIGAIEQRTCLEAILSSSPELTSNPDADYAVYAYDYSEANTPLVGQGMLSKVISQDAGANETMVTGKVTKSLLAKLSKNAQPFLEVKLRFTPMTASGLQRARSGSMSSINEGVQAQFASFSQTGPSGIDRPQSPAEISRYQNFERMVHEGGPRRESSFNNSISYNATSRPSSRPGTPTQYQQMPPQQPGSTHSRHNSHYNTFQIHHARNGSFSGYYSGDEAQEEGPAKKRARLTQVTQVKKSNFNIEQQPSSLRTAAMSASSLRIHQPTAVNPIAALQKAISGEGADRPPTPKPTRTKTGRPRGRPRKNRDFEQDDSSVEPSSPVSRLALPPQLPGSNMSSPEETRERARQESVASSPALPSSPPAIPCNDDLPQQSVEPSSPVLPGRLSRPAYTNDEHDSGFMSAQPEEDVTKGNDLFGDFNPMAFDDFSQWLDDPLETPGTQQDQNENGMQNHYTPVFDDESTFEGPTPQPDQSQALAPTPQSVSELQHIPVPTLQNTLDPKTESRLHTQVLNQVRPQAKSSFPRPPLPQQASFQQPATIDRNGRPVPTLLPRPTQQPMLHRTQSVLPQVAASDPVDRSFQRSNTWAPDMSDAIMSDAAGPEGEKRKSVRKRIGKEQTKARLENAIATGNLPPYCHNCGAIETPAWRRGYVKIFSCPIDSVPTSLNPGECCYKQVTSENPDGSVREWKGWTVERPSGSLDDGWEQINLCNPCGLWFHKTKTPRPPEKWQKKDPKEKRKRKRPPKPPRSRTNPPRAAAGNLQSDAQEPPSEDSSPADTSMEDGPDDNPDENGDDATVMEERDGSSEEPQLPPMPKSMSAITSRRMVTFGSFTTRQVQSSPITRGTAAEPIDIDLTPKPIRRVLFPSPKGQEAQQTTAVLAEKTNDALLPSFVRRSPRINKVRDVLAENFVASAVTADGSVEQDGKENMTPRVQVNDQDDDLFGDFTMMPPPTTPTPKRRSERILLRTPGRTPGRDFGAEISGNASGSPKSKTPKHSSIDFAGIFMDSATRNLDPEQMTPFTRIIHAAAITPKSKNKINIGFTPKRGNKAAEFDFPDLPSLNTSSPFSKPHDTDLFSELPTERLFSEFDDLPATDRPMPSSPPVNNLSGWDNFHDFMNIDQFDAVDWDALEDEKNDPTSKLKTPKKGQAGLLGVSTPGREGLRRSPRRAGQQ